MANIGPSFEMQRYAAPLQQWTALHAQWAGQRPVRWRLDYQKALASAANAAKLWKPGMGAGLVLAYFGGSDWCAPCIALHDEVWESFTFRVFFNGRPMVPLLLDFPNNTPQDPDIEAQNQQLADQYNVNGFPTVLAIKYDGSEIDRVGGYSAGSGPDKWIQAFQDASGVN